MSILAKLVFLPALFTLVKTDLPLLDVEIETPLMRNVDESFYRVPEDLDPIHIDWEMTPYFEREGTKEAFTFDGEVTIQVIARAPVNSLIVQENVREIQSVSVFDNDGVTLPLNPNRPFERLRDFHFLQINLVEGSNLVVGQNYTIYIAYIGNINETPLSRGVFRGNYIDDNGGVHWYAGSHLQPTNSRQAFPCFDEPGFKSTFGIIINRPSHFNDTYSNMQIAQRIPFGNRVKEIFHITPRMSAYLVSIHISEDFTVIADNGDANRSYRILARPNAQGQGEYALEVGVPLTAWLEDYFQIDYYTMGEDMKNDQIASPYWASGATENWGLVSYRELRLLYEEGETNTNDKNAIGTITAHELAHKWFGNLITCRWWDNVWINEGFASYFEYFAMDGVYPELELEDRFIIMYLQSALSADQGVSNRALQFTVNTPAQVTSHFSGIVYSKGASLLMMLKHFLSENTFKKALNYFLVDRSYEHAFPEDLYAGFARAVAEDNALVGLNVDISAFMRYWIDEPGFPVIDVTINPDTGVMDITQERFFISPSAQQTEQIWPIPLTFTTGSNPNWLNLTPQHVMTGRQYQITKEARQEWVVFNIQERGIYRVNYDTNNWELLAAALYENHNNFHRTQRAQIVDDVFAFMRSERISFTLGFRILEFLKRDTSFYAWYPAVTGFSWLRNRLIHIPDRRAEFESILYDFLTEVISSLGYEVRATDSDSLKLHRFFLLTFACDIGHEGCRTNARQQWLAFRNNGVRVHPDIRRHVYCEGLRQGDYSDWTFLLQQWRASNNQAAEVAMLRALGCSTDPQAVQEYLELILTDEVKAQDRANAFTFLFIGDRANANAALPFFKERINDIRTATVLPTFFSTVISSYASYLDEEGLADMEAWLNANQATVPEAATGISAIASARANMDWGTQRVNELLTAARGSAAVFAPATLLIIAALVASMMQ